MAEKKNSEELFKDYIPETMYYDPEAEGGSMQTARKHPLSKEERQKDDLIRLKERERSDKMAKKSLEELLESYVPEVMYYDPEVDGGDEHMIRDAHLSEKERLKDVITRLKAKNRGDRKVRR